MLKRVLLIVFCLTVSFTAAEAKRVALVIGNSNYQNTSVLANPANDARLMETALRDAGFEVTMVLDADKDTMGRALLEFGRTLRKGVDASLFYYAGHGVQVKGENYLVPINANLESEDEVDLQTYPVNAFLRTMESAKSPVNIVVLDACRNNPFARSFRNTGGGLAPVNAPRGSYIAYATAPGAVASDGESNNSPYTEALASMLSTPGLRLEDVFKKTREKVLNATNDEQVPWETSSITGDFFFKGGAAQADSKQADSKADSNLNAVQLEWSLVQNSTSKAVLEAFRDKYNNEPIYRGLVEEKLALLAPPQPNEAECTGVSTTVHGQSRCLKASDIFKDCDSCPEMVVIPAGSFMMGSLVTDLNITSDELPQHPVTFSKAFAAGRFELTRGQFSEFKQETAYDAGVTCRMHDGTAWVDKEGFNFSNTGFSQNDAHPVTCISWQDAQQYLSWLSKKTGVKYRLLSEAEWEYSARAGTQTTYLTGETITTQLANYNAEKRGTTEVGTYISNAFGLYDMFGNIGEWVEDNWEESYNNAKPNGKPTRNDTGMHVFRGGAWGDAVLVMRSADRYWDASNVRYHILGFRVARDL